MKAYIITYAGEKHSVISGNLLGFQTGLFGSDATYKEVTYFTDQELQERDERIARDYFIKGWNEACKWYVEIDKRDAAKEMREIDRLLKDYKKSKGVK